AGRGRANSQRARTRAARHPVRGAGTEVERRPDRTSDGGGHLAARGGMDALYDRIGIDYADLRRPDPRIARRIHHALGLAKSVLNVGAGTGAYEPADRQVTAVEPSAEMIRQREPSAAPAIQGRAEALPFADKSFDAAMA